MERRSITLSINPSRWGRPTTAAERQTFRLFCRKQFIKRKEELTKNREEATKKYKEEMAGYCISSMEGDIHTICRSHDLPHGNGNKPPLVFSIPDLCSPDRSILDVSTKDFHTISSPHLQAALCLYNKGEWLLMCHKEVSSEKHQNSLFLLNPASGSRIDLPRQYEEVILLSVSPVESHAMLSMLAGRTPTVLLFKKLVPVIVLGRCMSLVILIRILQSFQFCDWKVGSVH